MAKKPEVAIVPRRGRPAGATVKPKTDAEKGANFKSRASKRMVQLIRGIRALGKLSSTRSSKYSAEQVAKIFSALETELATAQTRYEDELAGRSRGKTSDISFEV